MLVLGARGVGNRTGCDCTGAFCVVNNSVSSRLAHARAPGGGGQSRWATAAIVRAGVQY
jgi:hypothetical protein